MKIAFFAILISLAGCAHQKDDLTVCPEHRDLRCLGDTICTMDNSRGCQVCRCDSVAGDHGAVDEPPPDRPPDEGPNPR
jgi:hypothetical protein